MRIQPIPPQVLHLHILRPRDPAQTPLRPTSTVKLLRHFPFRTRIEERQHIPLLERAIRCHSDLHGGHVEDKRRITGMIRVQEVGVELDVCVGADLDC